MKKKNCGEGEGRGVLQNSTGFSWGLAKKTMSDHKEGGMSQNVQKYVYMVYEYPQSKIRYNIVLYTTQNG